MTDITDIEKRLRELLPVASSIDRLLVSVTNLRTLLDALTAERERADKAEKELHTVLARETATQARHDKRLDDLEAELARLRAPVGDVGEVVRQLDEAIAEAAGPLASECRDLLTRQAAEIAAERAARLKLQREWDEMLTGARALRAKLETKP